MNIVNINFGFFDFLLVFFGIAIAYLLLMTGFKANSVPRNIRERNKQASLLCRKVYKGEELSFNENMVFKKLISDKVIEKNNEGTYMLSDKALMEAMGVKKKE